MDVCCSPEQKALHQGFDLACVLKLRGDGRVTHQKLH